MLNHISEGTIAAKAEIEAAYVLRCTAEIAKATIEADLAAEAAAIAKELTHETKAEMMKVGAADGHFVYDEPGGDHLAEIMGFIKAKFQTHPWTQKFYSTLGKPYAAEPSRVN